MTLFDLSGGGISAHELTQLIWILLSRTPDREATIRLEDVVRANQPGAGVDFTLSGDKRSIRLRVYDRPPVETQIKPGDPSFGSVRRT